MLKKSEVKLNELDPQQNQQIDVSEVNGVRNAELMH